MANPYCCPSPRRSWRMSTSRQDISLSSCRMKLKPKAAPRRESTMSPDHVLEGASDAIFKTITTPVAGLIFDMDGTLVDNMRVHNDAWEVWHQRHGLVFNRESFFRDTAGRSN